MRAAEHALRFLVKAGVRHVFGVPGGTVNPFYDAMLDVQDLTSIVSRHEGAAAYAAASYAKHSGRLGVVLGCSGPGASNLLTGVASCMRERLPLLVLTGQVPSPRMGLGAAQEASAWNLDMVSAFRPFCKHSLTVSRPEDLSAALRLAILSATSVPCGPVHIAMPLEMQMADLEIPVPAPLAASAVKGVETQDLETILQLLSAGPGVIFCGSGVKKARAEAELRRLAELTGWMVVTTPAGKGCFPENHPLGFGVYGLAGNASSKEAMLMPRVLILGSSLGELATRNWTSDFLDGKRSIQIDNDPASMGKHYQPTLTCVADVRAVLRQVLPRLSGKKHPLPLVKQKEKLGGKLAYHMQALSSMLPEDHLVVSDIGEHMTWALRHWTVKDKSGFDININYGGMGSGISSVIGAQLAQPRRPIVCLTGDGCVAMHGFEIHTAAQYGLPILFVVVNNRQYGMVQWGHELQYQRAPQDFRYPPLDISLLAAGMGVPTERVSTIDDWRKIDFDALFARGGPTVIELMDDGTSTPPMADRVAFLKGNRR